MNTIKELKNLSNVNDIIDAVNDILIQQKSSLTNCEFELVDTIFDTFIKEFTHNQFAPEYNDETNAKLFNFWTDNLIFKLDNLFEYISNIKDHDLMLDLLNYNIPNTPSILFELVKTPIAKEQEIDVNILILGVLVGIIFLILKLPINMLVHLIIEMVKLLWHIVKMPYDLILEIRLNIKSTIETINKGK